MTCTHSWEPTTIIRTSTGLRHQDIIDVTYCRLCGHFGGKTRVHADGRFCKPGDLPQVQKTEDQAYHKARAE